MAIDFEQSTKDCNEIHYRLKAHMQTLGDSSRNSTSNTAASKRGVSVSVAITHTSHLCPSPIQAPVFLVYFLVDSTRAACVSLYAITQSTLECTLGHTHKPLF